MASKLHVATLEHVLELANTAVHKDLPLYQFRGEVQRLLNDAKAGAATVVHDVEEVVHEVETAVETVVDRLKKAKSHADLAAIAHELQVDIPAEVKAAWGDAKGVPAKKAVLEPLAEAKVAADAAAPTTG